MRILALEPYYGGSHKAFIDGWSQASRHDFTILGLPPYKWKWRMRHSALTFAEQVNERVAGGETVDRLFASSMLNLAEFKGLVDPVIAALPTVIYFHENQLTYPVQEERERDLHFAFTNLTTALAANQVWWNSAFHRDDYLAAKTRFLRRMPDHAPTNAVEQIREKSQVQYPGIHPIPATTHTDQPCHILWCARFEHDKNPALFFDALKEIASMPFRLSVIGEEFENAPDVFAEAKKRFADRIVHWGYQESREAYERVLQEADIVVSTADHEFFGIGIVEAVAAGCYPMLPDRLAYPEVIDKARNPDCFYDGTREGLVACLRDVLDRPRPDLSAQMAPYYWSNRATAMDDAIKASVVNDD